jgi:hypothetical protein
MHVHVIWPAFWMVIVVLAMVMRHRRRMLRMQLDRGGRAPAPLPDAVAGGERRELDDLRERVKVLERIATDANTSSALETRRIAEEIEALRDR